MNSQAHTFRLEIDGQVYDFTSPRQFEFGLSGRASLPAPKIIALMALDDDALLREAETVRRIEQRFGEALSGGLEDVVNLEKFLQSIDQTLISPDHDWRAIFAALSSNTAPEDYKRTTLVKYVQYLSSRQDVIRGLYANRHKARPPARSAIFEDRAPREDHDGGRDTVLFGPTYRGESSESQTQFTRLPKGETVEITLGPDDSLDLQLAQHQCVLLFRNGLVFIDHKGRSSQLQPGRNVVGRDFASDVALDSDLRDISRKHLIVETDGHGLVRLTDISSHGTSVPPRFVGAS